MCILLLALHCLQDYSYLLNSIAENTKLLQLYNDPTSSSSLKSNSNNNNNNSDSDSDGSSKEYEKMKRTARLVGLKLPDEE